MSPSELFRRMRLARGRPASLAAMVVLLAAVWLCSPFQTDVPFADGQEPDPMPQQHAHTNHLIKETSPYLLQHAHNPVDWYPWGEEAFGRAKRENKPIFLSVGYSTCYWCHVMEVESFEDEEVAAVINRHFVPIKVDREERPDIDEQYMLATQLMTQRGGWPNSVWLTPDGQPWMAGTYFPKAQFIQVLEKIAEVWETRRADVDRQAELLTTAIQQVSQAGTADTVELTPQLIDQAVRQLISRFDDVHGGFGDAPKFPPHGTLQLLAQQYRTTSDESLVRPLSATLDAMWLGGMHDHIGGGFHRYSTDAEWLLPHFEKMLYDNAQLIRSYTDGYQITGNERFREAVADIYGWVRREMTSPEGAFYSALDSGEVGQEGEAYVWRMERLTEVLNDEDAALFAMVYGFKPEGNFQEEATGERSGKNIPHLQQPIESLRHPAGAEKPDPALRLADIRSRLLAERRTWPQPRRDDKILTSWNGLLIGSLAYAGRVLDEPDYVQAAGTAADDILNRLVRDDTLLRTCRNGSARLPGYLDDYVFLTQGLLELYLATEDSRWLDQARRFATILVRDFEDKQNGGFFYTSADHEELMFRSRNFGGGGNMPNSNGIASQVLLRLANLTDNPAWRVSAVRTLESLSGLMATQPHSSEHLLIAASQYLAESDDRSVDDGLTRRVAPLAFYIRGPASGVQPGERVTIEIEIDIDEGWHLYAENPQAEFLIPSTVTVTAGEPLTVGSIEAPESQSKTDPILNKTVNTYSGRIRFVVPVMVQPQAAPGTTSLDIEVTTQACDSKRCLKPRTETFRLPLTITSVSPDAPSSEATPE